MVSIKAVQAKNPFSKAKGLLGTQKPFPFFLKTRFGIHTIGMKFPIDVVILDGQMKVRKLKENLLPYRIFLWNPQYYNVLELPVGSIKKYHLTVGTKITLKG